MSSDPPPIHPYSSILSNILSGTHPSYPSSPPSPLEHFARTCYASAIKPSIANAWELESAKLQGPISPKPPNEFCEKVIRDMFGALSTNELQTIEREVEQEWHMKEWYNESIRELYGDIDIQRSVTFIS
jgi:hypothetical protein